VKIYYKVTGMYGTGFWLLYVIQNVRFPRLKTALARSTQNNASLKELDDVVTMVANVVGCSIIHTGCKYRWCNGTDWSKRILIDCQEAGVTSLLEIARQLLNYNDPFKFL
jgi:hypothetical protein